MVGRRGGRVVRGVWFGQRRCVLRSAWALLNLDVIPAQLGRRAGRGAGRGAGRAHSTDAVEVLQAVVALDRFGSQAADTGSTDTMGARGHGDDGLDLEVGTDAPCAQGVLIGRVQVLQEARLENPEAARLGQALWILGHGVEAGTAQGVTAEALSAVLVAHVADVPATVAVQFDGHDEGTES